MKWIKAEPEEIDHQHPHTYNNKKGRHRRLPQLNQSHIELLQTIIILTNKSSDIEIQTKITNIVEVQ